MHTVLYIVLVTAALVYGKSSYVSIPPEFLPDMLNQSVDCVGKTGIDEETMQKILAWKFEDTDRTRKFIYCFAVSTGYADKNGHLVKDNILKLAGNHRNKNELGEVVDDCNSSKGASKYETMYKTAVCLLEKSPILFTL